MSENYDDLRKRFRISGLCKVFEATLRPCWQEGFPLHYVHRMPTPVVLGDRGHLCLDPDPQMAIAFGMSRHTALDVLLEDGSTFPHRAPDESLLLALPVGQPLNTYRTRFLDQSAKLWLEWAEEMRRLRVVAVSHRRRVHDRLLVRHQPAAIFDLNEIPIWVHPAAHSYGLATVPFPDHQTCRCLGPRRRCSAEPDRRWLIDDATGLPAWYQYARERLREEQDEDEPLMEAVIDFQVQCWLQRSIAEDSEAALRESVRLFVRGFEALFGMGGLMPVPGQLDLP